MRKAIKLPRILKINWIDGLRVSVVFNNGESRVIDFAKVLNSILINEDSPAWILYTPDELGRVKLVNNTLSWPNVVQHITGRDGSLIRVPFEIGADTLLKYSEPDGSESLLKIGCLVREARIKSGLSQQQLALISGTSRSYISRIENDKSDIELTTLRKIIETGLGKRLEIHIR